MAAFRTHITVSTLGGIGVAAAGYNYGIPLESCLLALGLCSVSGMLPDLDSSSGIPFRESVAFISAFVPMLLISRFQHFGWDRETIILAAALIYIGIRFGIAEVFRRYTVHRGMWHSLPAAASVGLLAFLITDDRDLILRCYWGGAAVAGFMSHLILDEIYSVNFRGVRLKNSFGTAVKLWSRRGLWPNVSTYGKLAVLVLLAWGDPMLMKWVEQRETVTFARCGRRISHWRPRGRSSPRLSTACCASAGSGRSGSRAPAAADRVHPRWLSTISVTGPSLTRETSIRARKRPVATRTPRCWTARVKWSYSFSASSGGAASAKLGRRPLRQSPQSVNWLTTSISPPISASDRFIFPCSSSKIRSVTNLSAR